MPKRIKNYLGRNFSKDRENDKLSKPLRSTLMSKIRSKDTGLEKYFIILLKKNIKKKFHKNVVTLKGSPDIVFVKSKLCLFIDSDFWHGWQYPRWRHLLKNNFWKNKIRQNRERDIKNSNYLKKNGWQVIRVWEHQIKTNPEIVIQKIAAALQRLDIN